MLLIAMQVLLMLNFQSSFNLDLQFTDTESEAKSKLMKLLIRLKGFEFLITLALVFKKIEMNIKRTMKIFLQAQSRNNYQRKWHWWCV